MTRFRNIAFQRFLFKLRSSRAESNRPLRATCTKTAAPTWHAEAILTLLLFWPTVARSGRLDADLDERSFNLSHPLKPGLHRTVRQSDKKSSFLGVHSSYLSKLYGWHQKCGFFQAEKFQGRRLKKTMVNHSFWVDFLGFCVPLIGLDHIDKHFALSI